jgi:hypothetical protein
MAGRGPLPNPNAVRRNARTAGITLPAEGRKGRTPKWPLPDDLLLGARVQVLEAEQADLERLLQDATDKEAKSLRHRLGQNVERLTIARGMIELGKKAELTLWRELWKTPHAVMWERLRWTREVAQYARWKAKAELGDIDASREARMLADRLGLTPKAMQDLRWTIASDEVAEKRQEQAPTGARARIKAV